MFSVAGRDHAERAFSVTSTRMAGMMISTVDSHSRRLQQGGANVPKDQAELDRELISLAATLPNESTERLTQQLLAEGANPDACCAVFGGSAIHETTFWDNYIVTSELIKAGADINNLNNKDETPLHDAATNNAAMVAEVLVKAKAELNVKDQGGETPLHHAAAHGNVRIAEILLKAGADKTITTKYGTTPADVICEEVCQDGSHAKLTDLLKVKTVAPDGGILKKDPTALAGGKKRDIDEDLLLLASAPVTSSTRNEVSKLLSKGANPDACCNEFGGSALHIASDLDNDVVALALVTTGANMEVIDALGDTPLHDAAIVNSHNVAEVLLDAGANVDARDNKGQTPLHHASEWGSVNVAKLLIAAGANVTATDVNGTLPSDIICKSSCRKKAKKQLRKLLPDGALQPEEGKSTKSTGISTKLQKKLNAGLLTIAEAEETPSTVAEVQELLARGADPNACCNRFGGSALHEVSAKDNAAVAAALVDAGAEVDRLDPFVHTPLHDAAIANAARVAGILIDAGADVNAVDGVGDTPLHLAAEWGSLQVAQVLLATRVDTEVENTAGKRPVEVICASLCLDPSVNGKLTRLLAVG